MKKPRKCACGCDRMTKGGIYCPGHDAKHRSYLMATGAFHDKSRRELEKKGWANNYPEWARDLVERVCRDNRRKPPLVIWKSNGRVYSSGTTYSGSGRIVMRVGSNQTQAKIILLHELAHYLCPPKTQHAKLFWAKAWRLYVEYDADLFAACVSEFTYKKKAWQYCPSDIRQWYTEQVEHIKAAGKEPKPLTYEQIVAWASQTQENESHDCQEAGCA